MLGGMVCSGILDRVGHGLSQDTCFYVGNEIVLMSEKLAWGRWERKWKSIYGGDERLAGDEQGWSESSIRDLRVGTPLALLSMWATPLHSFTPRLFTCHLPLAEAVLGLWEPAENKVDRNTLSGDDMLMIWSTVNR